MLYEVITDASGREFLSTLYDQIGAMSNLRIVLIGLPESIEIGGLDPSNVITSSIGPDDVITSYSIHYTKLYDVFQEFGTRRPLDLDQGRTFLHSLPGCSNTAANPVRRITSYNVCYTKLLRHPG